MIKECILLFSLLLKLPVLLFSQNLVPNPSFECGTDICDANEDASKYEIYACGWTCPNTGTSDVLNTRIKDKTCFSSMPYRANNLSRFIGSQLPRTGNRFAGIVSYLWMFPYREYIQTKLKTALIPGEYYCAEMYVSSADFANFSCNNIGMYFADSETNVLTPNPEPLPFLPQIVERNIINDTVNWVRISGTFKATSSAKYLVIGNFNTNAETTIVTKFLNGHNSAYYFIDDVSVEHMPKKNLTYTGETEICQGKSTTLKALGDFENITWTTLADTLTILNIGDSLKVTPQVTTQYRVKVQNCNLSIKDTITVKVNPFLKVDLGKDTTICDGSSIDLNAGTFFGTIYSWQDESTSQYLKVNRAGKYSVTVTNHFNNCKAYDEVNISIKTVPKIELGKDTLVCKDYYPLKAGEGGTRFQWSTGSTDSIFTPAKSGKYWVTVDNRCGQSRDSIRIYSAVDIMVPNVLTLNGDKLNEEFKVVLIEDKEANLNTELNVPGKLIIFNRWGNEIFSDNNYINGWPPGNKDLEQGVYYYRFNYLNCPTYKGSIHVLK